MPLAFFAPRNRSLGQSFYSKLRDKRVLHSFGYCRGKKNDGIPGCREWPVQLVASEHSVTQAPSFGETGGQAQHNWFNCGAS